ncbi:hypothetical protein PR048_006817 [Dryococelus australis]|uniref:Transposase n=1 Tax=Dryococelus australis TaxID=614101 RepID=A0ABQ9IBZ5_9NEOP|nr:hypothetical protein PR048_006817 [Dryococelus australis]
MASLARSVYGTPFANQLPVTYLTSSSPAGCQHTIANQTQRPSPDHSTAKQSVGTPTSKEPPRHFVSPQLNDRQSLVKAIRLSAVTRLSLVRRGTSVKRTDDGRLQNKGERGVCVVNGRKGPALLPPTRELGPILGPVTPGFSHVGIIPDDTVDRRVFSGISRLPHPFIPALLHSHLFTLIGSQDLAVKSLPPQFSPCSANPQCSRVLRAPSRTVGFNRRVARPLVHSYHEHLARHRPVVRTQLRSRTRPDSLRQRLLAAGPLHTGRRGCDASKSRRCQSFTGFLEGVDKATRQRARRPGPLVFVRGGMNTEPYCNILDNEMLPTLWRFYGMDPCYFQDDNARCHVPRATMQWYADNNVRRLDWPAQSSDLNPIEHLCDELVRRVRARQARPKSTAQLVEWLQEEWRRIPVDVLQTLVEGMPYRGKVYSAQTGNKTRFLMEKFGIGEDPAARLTGVPKTKLTIRSNFTPGECLSTGDGNDPPLHPLVTRTLVSDPTRRPTPQVKVTRAPTRHLPQQHNVERSCLVTQTFSHGHRYQRTREIAYSRFLQYFFNQTFNPFSSSVHDRGHVAREGYLWSPLYTTVSGLGFQRLPCDKHDLLKFQQLSFEKRLTQTSVNTQHVVHWSQEARPTQLLACSSPTKPNRVQSPARTLMRESCQTIPLVGGLSRGYPVSPDPSFRSCSILASITLIGFQDLATIDSGLQCQTVFSDFVIIGFSGLPPTMVANLKTYSRQKCGETASRLQQSSAVNLHCHRRTTAPYSSGHDCPWLHGGATRPLFTSFSHFTLHVFTLQDFSFAYYAEIPRFLVGHRIKSRRYSEIQMRKQCTEVQNAAGESGSNSCCRNGEFSSAVTAAEIS